ncbi:MAG: hypothetical protein ACRDJ9_18290, partial [Dehalococcoidia bacterium]
VLDGEASETPGTVAETGRDAAAIDRNGRHRTLTSTVGWSYRTLDERPARLLRQMAVFAGWVDLTAVEWLLDGEALGPLTMLVDKSLVRAEGEPGNTRYRMLDTIRAYAARKLAALGEDTAARDRHVAWCLHAIEGDPAPPLSLIPRPVDRSASARQASRAASLNAIDSLIEEVRQALHWSATGGEVQYGLRLAAVLQDWWQTRGHAREGRVWLFRLYERMAATGAPIPHKDLVAAYRAHAELAGTDGELGEQARFLQRAHQVAQRANDPRFAHPGDRPPERHSLSLRSRMAPAQSPGLARRYGCL